VGTFVAFVFHEIITTRTVFLNGWTLRALCAALILLIDEETGS
jgi:hypothetical protein